MALTGPCVAKAALLIPPPRDVLQPQEDRLISIALSVAQIAAATVKIDLLIW
jgi:hypothetical protein